MQIMLDGQKIWINFHHLHYFYVVVNEGSLAKASKVLSVGQPSLSSQLKQLELNLETELFDRSGKKLELTEQGRLAHEMASEIFNLGSDLVRKLYARKKTSSQQLNVGVIEGTPRKYIAHLCKNILKFPGKTINLTVKTQEELLAGLKENRFDFLVSNTPFSGDTTICSKIASSPYVICGGRRFKDLAQNFPKSIVGQPFMMPIPGTRLRSELDTYFRRSALKVMSIGETLDTDMLKIIASENLGLIVVPTHCIEDLIDIKDIYEIGRPHLSTEDLYVITTRQDGKTILSGMELSF